ncbi:MarR family winged helix-turn-helix transcriptional regulator [Liquorilactobacillus sicerae]|uniref:MarR family winged helix-turn-helix transcriptional regulator n=1 Tax=Liquorilactobacillus sicerae TaxID=1416943 RepID=UPI002480E7A8|nr:MarR family winged helix-turn-helix transcriptional regulator [Liquorilactobacillus sicerae]
MKSNRSMQLLEQLAKTSRSFQAFKQTNYRDNVELLNYLAAHQKSTAKMLAQYLQITAPSVSAKLNQLQHSGLIVKKVDPNDHRSSQLALTGKGQQQLEFERKKMAEQATRLFAELNKKQKKQLIRLLRTIEETFINGL